MAHQAYIIELLLAPAFSLIHPSHAYRTVRRLGASPGERNPHFTQRHQFFSLFFFVIKCQQEYRNIQFASLKRRQRLWSECKFNCTTNGSLKFASFSHNRILFNFFSFLFSKIWLFHFNCVSAPA